MTTRLLDNAKLQVTTLRLLTMGRRITDVATAVNAPIADVESFARQHGWPDRSLMPALERIQATIDNPLADEPAADIPDDAEPSPVVEPAGPFDATFALLLRAQESGRPDTRDLAARVGKHLAELRDLLDAEERERRDAEADVRRLETELVAARERLSAALGEPPAAGFTPKLSPAYVPAIVRAWAKDQGIPCPDKGRVPQPVVDAYKEAGRT